MAGLTMANSALELASSISNCRRRRTAATQSAVRFLSATDEFPDWVRSELYRSFSASVELGDAFGSVVVVT